MSKPNSNTDFIIDADELLGRMMGSVDLAQRMLLRFVASAAEETDLLDSLIRSGDVKETESLAHRHAGTAKTLAIHRVAKTAMLIEQHAREQPFDCSRLLEMVQLLRQQHQEVTDFAATEQIHDSIANGQGDLS